MTALVILITLLAMVACSFIAGVLLYTLAPLAGYDTPEGRQDWRTFGFSYGWLALGPVMLYWLADVIAYRALDGGSARKYS